MRDTIYCGPEEGQEKVERVQKTFDEVFVELSDMQSKLQAMKERLRKDQFDAKTNPNGIFFEQ